MRGLDPAQRVAFRSAFRAWLLSRTLVWGAGFAAVLIAGPGDPVNHDLDMRTEPFGELGDKLVAPSARWDSKWFLEIADDGYDRPLARAFYPLYPLLARAVGAPFGSSLVGGIVVSLAALLVALYLLHRLTALELGAENAGRAVLLMAFFPTSLFFSAVYAEALFLALAIGCVYAARLDRWALAGVLGGLATMTRPPGILLLVPLALLYLYGPRGGEEGRTRLRLKPLHRPSLNVLWLLAIPAGIAAHGAYLGATVGDALGAFGHQEAWNRGLTFPLATIWNSAVSAGEGLFGLLSRELPDNVYEFGFMAVACIAAIALLRRAPVAYGAYLAVGVGLLLVYPINGGPAGFSRQISVLFPLYMWLAAWSGERRVFKVLLAAFALLMMVNSVRFATWHWVA